MSISKIFTIFLIIWTFCGCQPEAKVSELVYQTAEKDTLMGDWKGTMQAGQDEPQQVVAQVIAYKDNNYRVNLLEQFDTRDSAIARLTGQKQNGEIMVRGADKQNRNWQGTIKGKNFNGTFAGSSQGTFSLEKIVRLSPTLGQLPPENAIVLFNGHDLDQWVHPPSMPGYVSLAELIGGNDRVAYLRNDIWSERDQKAVLLVGSDDGNKIWLNGEQVHAINAGRGAEPGQDTVNISLNKGWNTLLFKVINGDGGWGVLAQLTDVDGNPLNEIQEKDFANNDQPTSEYIDENNGYLSVWRISEAYLREGADAGKLFNIAFAPETDLQSANWQVYKVDNSMKKAATWTIIDDVMQVKPGSGSVMTDQKFNDFKLHIEFRSPFMPDVTGQKRGNSGVYLQGRYEIQVLDSYGLEGKDNECGGFYKVARPDVNMCAPPAQWQTYDVDFKAARYDTNGKKQSSTVVTVRHNGVIIHENLEIPVATAGGLDRDMSKPGPILLQDHGDLVQFRNIWLVETNQGK